MPAPLRARIVRLSRHGDAVAEIAKTLGVCPDTVRRWIHRFDRRRVDGLVDRPRTGTGPRASRSNGGAPARS